MRPQRCSAFSLVEILVAAVILAVLTALLLPGVQSGVRSANQSRCAANLRQIGASLIAYSADHNGSTVATLIKNGPNWSETLVDWDGTKSTLWIAHGPETFIKSGPLGVWRCPENRDQKIAPAGSGGGEREGSYMINGWNDSSSTSGNAYSNNLLANISSPSKLYMVMEGAYYRADGTQDGQGAIPNGIYKGKGLRSARYPHGGKMNIVFADGHVEAVSGPLTRGAVLGGDSNRAASYSNGAHWFAN